MGLFNTKFGDMTPRDIAGAGATVGIGYGIAALLMLIPGVFEYFDGAVDNWEIDWAYNGLGGRVGMLLFRLPLIVFIVLPLLILFNWVFVPAVYFAFYAMILMVIFVALVPFFGGGYMIACMTGADVVASLCR